MNIALLGYGKMGKEIEKIAVSRNHQIVAKIDSPTDWETQKQQLKDADVAIEFSTPDTVLGNIYKCFDLNLPVVVGTTGWQKQAEEVESYCLAHNQSLFYASNFSVGVNIFFEVNKLLAKLMSSQLQYDIKMTEAHHIHKLDAPSGTAISLADGIIQNHQGKTNWKLDTDDYSQNDIPIKAIREGEVPGTHTIEYDSDVDIISITHEAKSRKGFALGAVLAAEFLKGRKGVFGMKDLLAL
ncbi:4-hydroxy-tetrahydrodipicolinate reductase [Bacteroidales bacterium OttesenSCG-928-C19]|nr:4-hydroxy-tetrahydrodipicolinate reductase [Bacteroidales bacterium OttesenSCG-928-C19]